MKRMCENIKMKLMESLNQNRTLVQSYRAIDRAV